jgi:hypothetical protein
MKKVNPAEYFQSIHGELAKGKAWPEALTGKLKFTGEFQQSAREWGLGIGGQIHPALYSSNVEKLVKRKETSLMAGICLVSAGVLRATQNVDGKQYSIDISQEIPKEILRESRSSFAQWTANGSFNPEGGTPKLKLGRKWKFQGITDPGITLGKVMKIFRYFEIAHALNKPLNFVLPTIEYSITAEENAKKLGIDPSSVRKTMIKVGENYEEIIKAIQREFFPKIKTNIMLTHENRIYGRIEKEANSREFHSAIKSTEGSYMDAWARTTAKDKEEARFLAIFTRLTNKPTIWLLNGRDTDTIFPFSLKVVEKAQKGQGKRFGLIGVPGGPAIRTWNSFRQKNDLLRYDHPATAADDYFGRYPHQTANIRQPQKLESAELLLDAKGNPTISYYLHNLGPYFGIASEKGNEIGQYQRLVKKIQQRLLGPYKLN